MGKRRESLLFKFGIIFIIFTIVMLILSGIATYYNQNKSYKLEREESIQYVASYLDNLLLTEGENFAYYQKYFLSHYRDILIPLNFGTTEIQLSKKNYEKLFSESYPGKVLGKDISFEELSDEVKLAFTIYHHEYFLDKFEKARKLFNLIYVEYIIPFESTETETLDVMYALDALRDERIVDGKKYIELGITVPHKLKNHKTEFEAWNTGKRPSGFDTFDNEYGKTYAFYSPVIINGEKLGVIGVEVEIAKVNRNILHNTLTQAAAIGSILIICVIIMLIIIYKKYISKLEHLKNNIGDYTVKKDVSITSEIERNATGNDEISILAKQFSSMVLEIENYMKTLLATTKELKDTKLHATVMSELATKDALTGIRNKTAYDKEFARLEWSIEEGTAEFGIAMVDLNFLKRINDTYGHEQGNIAIKKLCYIVCHVFEHSPVFRIGGDEFVIILENDDYKNIESLIKEFNDKLEAMSKEENLEQWEKVSAAIGYALYNASIDSSAANVFKRADKAMYNRKREMKAIREN